MAWTTWVDLGPPEWHPERRAFVEKTIIRLQRLVDDPGSDVSYGKRREDGTRRLISRKRSPAALDDRKKVLMEMKREWWRIEHPLEDYPPELSIDPWDPNSPI